MSSFKEIVTKAVVGKGKKSFTTDHTLELENEPSTILGCWIINHVFKGTKEKDAVRVEGSFDTNVWYSKNNNTETEVVKQTVNYSELVPIKTEEDYDGQDEIIVRMIKQPTCLKAEIKDKKIEYQIEETIAAELVGDAKIRVGIDQVEETETDEEINDEIKEDFLK